MSTHDFPSTGADSIDDITGLQAALDAPATALSGEQVKLIGTSQAFLGFFRDGTGDTRSGSVGDVGDGITRLQGDGSVAITAANGSGDVDISAASFRLNSSDIATEAYADAAAAAVASGWTMVSKATTETITSDSTLGDDADLKFSVAANTKYRFRFHVMYRSPDTPDFKFALTGPSSPTLLSAHMSVAPAFGSVTNYRASGQYSDLAASLTGSPASTVNEGGFVIIEGVLHNGSNAGTVAFQWAQNTSDGGSTSVLAGSYVEYKTV